MSKKYLLVVMVIALVVFASFGCGQKAAAPEPAPDTTAPAEVTYEGEMKIGILVPTTGSEATYGKDMENSFNMAVDEINAKGGIMKQKIVTITGDDACDPQMATAAANKLVSSGVVAVVGGYCSGATLPTLSIFNDAKLPFIITAANSSKLAATNPGNSFQTNGTAANQVAKAIEMWQAGGVKTVAIVNQGDGYSADLANLAKTEFEKAGGQVVSMEVMNKGEQDTSALVTGIKAKKPDLVFWTAYFADGGIFIKQLRQGGYTGKIMVGDGSCDPQLMTIGGSATDGVQVLSSPNPAFLPNAAAWVTAYKAKYNQDPGPYSALSYDGMNLLADAYTRANSMDFAAVVKALQETKDLQGLSGVINFAPDHTLATSNFMVVECQGGKFVFVK